MESYKTSFENYEISDLGNLRKLMRDGTYKYLKCSILKTGGGYKYIQITRNGKRNNILIHRLVALAFIGPQPSDEPYVDHINRNSLDNRVDNLRWINHQGNMQNTDKYRNDISETGNARLNTLGRERCELIRRSKKYYCELCNIPHTCAYHLNIHNEGYRHKLKEKHKKEMENNNIEWSLSNYDKFRRRKNDLDRIARRKMSRNQGQRKFQL